MDFNKQINTGEKSVSVIMLTYNRGNYILDSINSVLSQKYQNLELIVIDDGSSDNTAEIIKSINDNRLKYLQYKSNKGIAYRRARSLNNLRGDFVAIIDSDDIWVDKNKLQKQVNFLTANPDYSLIGSQVRLIDSDGDTLGYKKFALDDQKIRRKILFRNQFAHSSVLFREETLRSIGGYNSLSFAEDLDLYLRLGMVSKFSNLSFCTTSYRVHSSSETSKKLDMVSSVIKIIDNFKGYYPNFFVAKIKYKIIFFALLLFNKINENI